MARPTLPRGFAIRPGHFSDIRASSRVYTASFGRTDIFDVFFPLRASHPPSDIDRFVLRLFLDRYFNPVWDFSVIVTESTPEEPLSRSEQGRIVGLTWWRRPESEMSFYERWVSPSSWIYPFVKGYLTIVKYFRPLPGASSPNNAISVFGDIIHDLEDSLLTTPARRSAWYLSTLAIDPVYQSRRLGGALLQYGIDKADANGSRPPQSTIPAISEAQDRDEQQLLLSKPSPFRRVCWLIGGQGTEPFYQRFGFVEVTKANIGELASWRGGAVMFRE